MVRGINELRLRAVLIVGNTFGLSWSSRLKLHLVQLFITKS